MSSQCPACKQRDIDILEARILDKPKITLEAALVVFSGIVLFIVWLADPSLTTPLSVFTPLMLLLYWWLGFDWVYNTAARKWLRMRCKGCGHEWTWSLPVARHRRLD